MPSLTLPFFRLQLKYYHWELWTGIYMMERSEARILNFLFAFFFVMFLRWCYTLAAWIVAS